MKKSVITISVVCAALTVMSAVSAYAQGIAAHGFGAVNEGMGGAATGAANDAAGALHWNPGAISALERSEISFGLGLCLPTLSVYSENPLMAAGTGSSTKGEPGAVPLPAMALVKKTPDSCVTWGISMGVIGGSRLSYRGSMDNPILTAPNPANPLSGYGSLSADIQILQLAPTLSFQMTEKFSIGFAPTITMGNITCDPLYLVNELGYTDPAGAGTRWAWGAGFQIGAYYDTQCGWAFGVSYKRKQWMEDIRYNTVRTITAGPGAGTTVMDTLTVGLDYPDIVSFGLSFYGWKGWLFACDARYFMYGHTRGFDHLSWSSVWGISAGVQHDCTERLTIRGGYSWNENPIDAAATRDNVASPLIQQHGVYLGASYKITCRLTAHLAYSHMFKNSIEGEYFGTKAGGMGGQIPHGGVVRSTMAADTVMASFSVGF